MTRTDNPLSGAPQYGHRTAEQIGYTEAGPRPLPPLGSTQHVPLPAVVETTLDSGLRVLAVRRASVPMVELRLRVPFAGDDAAHTARAEVLASTLLAGTARRDRFVLDDELATLGAELGTGVDPERLILHGSALADGLPAVLDILADVLTGASHPDAEVARERDRLVDKLTVARAQPRVIAREALQRRRFGDHPISREMPHPADVADVAAGEVRALHAAQLVPDGATLVIVGDVDPDTALAAAGKALGDWVADVPARVLPPPPTVRGADLELVHRPGAVQSNLRLSAAAVPRDHPSYPALQLANLVFGGFFSSRLVENLREDKGYTYHASSGVEFVRDGAVLTVETDTATEVTAAALLETRYELARLAVVPPSTEEVDSAREYSVGSLLISLDNQGGLASTLSALVAAGLGIDWLRAHPGRLAEVGVDEVAAAALEFFAPSAFTGVVVGDADAVGAPLRALGGVGGP